jgi:N-acetylglucosaminyldiphosphoundecaprenol N-acetyl-beta-D-mannosaminyltransferase
MGDTSTHSIQILGVRVDDITMQEASDRIAALIAGGGAHQVATVNPEFIMAAQRDPEFAAVLSRTALNVPDGVGVLWAAKRLGHPIRERVAGVDLVRELCARGSQYKWRAYFLGAREGIAERAAASLAFQYQGLIVAGTYAGSPRPAYDKETVARVARARPNLLFVAYGAPAQDKWLARNLALVTAQAVTDAVDQTSAQLRENPSGLVGIGIGGAFDFITGIQQRAPEAIQRMGLEWLYRLLREPQRWRRQIALVGYALKVMLQSKKD